MSWDQAWKDVQEMRDRARRTFGPIDALRREAFRSWYCDQCQVEVYQLRCVHCGKSNSEAK